MNDYYQPTSSGAPSDDQPAEEGKDESITPVTNQSPLETATDGNSPPPEATPEPSPVKAEDSKLPPPEKIGGSSPVQAAQSASNPQEAYNAFIEALIVDLGFDKLEGPQKDQLIDAIRERVETRVLRTLMTSLTQEQSDEIDREVKEKGLTEEAIINLLVEKAPNASTAIISALDDLYMEMKEETDILWKAAGVQAAGQKQPDTQS